MFKMQELLNWTELVHARASIIRLRMSLIFVLQLELCWQRKTVKSKSTEKLFCAYRLQLNGRTYNVPALLPSEIDELI